MDASEVLYALPTMNATTAATLSAEMSLTPTPQTTTAATLSLPATPTPPLTISSNPVPTTPTTPRTNTHTPRELPTMYILDQTYDEYMDQYNGNNITTATESPGTNASIALAPCPICSRTFNPVTLRKHVGICEKMATKKRNIFDSSRQRREGTDLATYPLPKNFGLPEKATSNTSITPARGDRGQSPKPAAQQVTSPLMARKKPTEDLTRSTARASMRKAVSTANTTPTPAVATSTTSFTRDRMRSSDRSLTRRGIQPPPAEQCPHCERCFGIKAYDRHVEWCKEKALQASIKQGTSKNDGNAAKARLEARTKYRAPCLKTKRSINREKYSGMAGEEYENDENNKTQENNLMSISMTSSVCSERKNTNPTTLAGNINEPTTSTETKRTKKFSKRSSSIGSQKYACEKSQIRIQTPITSKKLTATAATTSTVAASPASAYEQENEPFENLETEMPQLYLMGEQMTSNAINKNLLEKTATTTIINKTKTKFDLLSMAEIKLKKQEQHLKENDKEQEHIQLNSEYNRNSKIPADIEISLPESLTYEKKKSPSDLSLKSMQSIINLRHESHKTLKTDNNYQDHNNICKSKANENVENLSTSLLFYNSQKNTVKKKLSKKSQSKTKQQHQNNLKSKINLEANDSSKTTTLQREIVTIENDIANSTQSRDMVNCMDENASNCSDNFQYELQFSNNNKQLYNNSHSITASNAENMKTSKLLTLPIAKHSTAKSKYKEITPETVGTPRMFSEMEMESTIGNKHNFPNSLNIRNEEEFENKNETSRSLTSFNNIISTEIYQDKIVKLDNDATVLKNSTKTKSDTFIRDLQNAYKEYENEISGNEYDNDLLASSDKFRISETPELRHVPKRKCTLQPLKSLQQPRLPSPPPKLYRSVTSTAHSFTSLSDAQPDINSIKSLNMFQPKRKKILRQTVSSSNTLPMKAMLLPKENLKLYNVSSESQMKTFTTNKVKEENETEEDYNNLSESDEEKIDIDGKAIHVLDKEIKVIKEPPPPQLKRNRSFTVNGLPDNYDPFLSAKRQLEELCSPTSDNVEVAPTTPHTLQMPSLPTTPSTKTMSTSLILNTSTPTTTPNLMNASQAPQQIPKTPILARSSSFRRTSSLRGPRRSPLLAARPPLFAQKHRPTIQRGLSDEGPISTNFLKPEEFDEMPVRSVCVNDFAINKSPRVVRRDASASNRKQPLKLNINAANANNSSVTVSPNVIEKAPPAKYVSKTDSLAVFLKYEHELEKLQNPPGLNEHKYENQEITKTPTTAVTPLENLGEPLNAKELKDKSNNLSKQNSAKSIKADILEINNSLENKDNLSKTDIKNIPENNDMEVSKYGQVRLSPLEAKHSTPLTKPCTPFTKLNTTITSNKSSTTELQQALCPASKSQEAKAPVALSSIFDNNNRTPITKNRSSIHSNLLYTEHKASIESEYIDPKLINKCDNLPVSLNLKRTEPKHSDFDASRAHMEHFSSSSSESSAPSLNKSNSLLQQNKILPSVRPQQTQTQDQNNYPKPDLQQHYNIASSSGANSQRNSAESRNLLKRRLRLGRNQFLYDASPEGDSCSADDEGTNRSSIERDTMHCNLLREHEKAFSRVSSDQGNPIDTPIIPPLPALDDFDFEEFLSSFENDEEQFPIFKDCREFLLNRTSKKQRSMLMPNSLAQNSTNTGTSMNNSSNLKKSPSPQTFPPLTPQSHFTTSQHFQFPALTQHPKNLFNSFSLNTRAKSKYDELTTNKSMGTFALKSDTEDYEQIDNHQKREIFISIETEQNDLDKSPISPTSIRNMVGNPQTVVEVEVDAAHDNKFSKISDDDTDNTQNTCESNNFTGHLKHLPNVQLNNAKNLMQNMQEDFRQMADEISGNPRLTMEHNRTTPVDVKIKSNTKMSTTRNPISRAHRSSGTPSGDAYADSDELSSLDGYPLSSPNSRLGVSSKTSADSAYGSLSRQRSSELTSQRSSSRSRPIASITANTVFNRPLTEESSLGRSRQLSASSSSSSEHALPPISKSNSYLKSQQQQQQHNFNNNNNNNNNNFQDQMHYELNNNNYDIQPMHATTSGSATNSLSNLESLQQYNTSNSTMSTSMKMSRFCHECGSKFLLEQAKFCMDCGVKRLIL